MVTNEIKGQVSRGRTYYRKDLTGYRTGLLTVLEFSHTGNNFASIWKCICDCGEIRFIPAGVLINGYRKSCGCLNLISNPKVKHRLHSIWTSIKQRCNNQKCTNYKNYGGRGIKFYEKWNNSYEAFYDDVIHLYKEGLQIDRINNDGNYEPGNIRWTTNKVNMRNRRKTFLNEESVREIRHSSLPHTELAKLYGVKKHTISMIRSKNCKCWEGVW